MSHNQIIKFSPGCPALSGDVPAILNKFVSLLKWNIPVNFTLTQKNDPTDESYELNLDLSGATIQAASEQGLFYGFQTLIRLCNEPEIRVASIKESPCADRRGLKLYLPAPDAEGISEFKKIIDFAAFCKCNFLLLELGGALEFKLHPEINEGYVKYAAEMQEYPGKTLDVQNKAPWRKNSIHTENGGGKIVSQQQFKELVEYCRKRLDRKSVV